MITKTALLVIDFYQRNLSPNKGFGCALRVTGGSTTGCSGYAKERIQTVGLLSAIPDIKQRFKACSKAAEDHKRSKRKDSMGKECAIDGCTSAPDACDCNPFS